MRQVFQTIEKNNYLPVGTPGHSFNGWFQTNMECTTSVTGPVAGVLTATANDLGQKTPHLPQLVSRDSNELSPSRDTSVGIYRLPRHTRSNGQRYSSRDYILETINTRQYPLTLSQASLATKILFNTSGGNPKAIGVEYLVGKTLYQADARYSANGPQGEKRTATARREVILSGGTFNSPQLLKLGGIGPADELRKFNISVLVDSPGVGANMQANQEMPIVGTLRANSGGLGTGGCVIFKQGCEADMGAMKNAIAWVRRIYARVATPVGPISPREPPCPSRQASGACSDPGIDESWIEAQTFGHHATSTCAIGADDDRNAVLDSKFRVRGVEGLCVVDASAFSRIPGVFPSVATFMKAKRLLILCFLITSSSSLSHNCTVPYNHEVRHDNAKMTQHVILETHIFASSPLTPPWARHFHVRLATLGVNKAKFLDVIRDQVARLGRGDPVVEPLVTLYFTPRTGGRVVSLPGCSPGPVNTMAVPYQPGPMMTIPPAVLYSPVPEGGWPLALTYHNGVNYLTQYGPPTVPAHTLFYDFGSVGYMAETVPNTEPPVVTDVLRSMRLDTIADADVPGLLEWVTGPHGLKLIVLVDLEAEFDPPEIVTPEENSGAQIPGDVAPFSV
ncbi:Choline dehydrogenase [Colletotrichum trifolii]|uniref:Choline dehydrogenase n=1 Tax=Colletotrichum trifolii TaxID=5466 RepID=A0A4R8QRM4_COLTR|nr:Choline dehydrogenase [Colletotrichum trifolii]